MISKVTIKNVASYSEEGQELTELKKVNFLFGTNGCGKTTISRVINDPTSYDQCSVNWDGPELETYVYNRDFVENNFSQTKELKGIFTLGEEGTELVKEIKEAKDELAKCRALIDNYTNKRGNEIDKSGTIGERDQLNKQFLEDAWKFKKKYEKDFRHALIGTMGKKPDFADRLRKEAQNKNTADLKTKEELLERAKTVFGDELTKYDPFVVPDTTGIVGLEGSSILEKKVVGKEDVNIAAMIEKLGNSDWVREGLKYREESGDTCPFCQQKTDEAFAKSLNEYFDETYLGDLDAINILTRTYDEYAVRLLDGLQQVLATESPFIDPALFKPQVDVLSEKISKNKTLLQRKKDEASTVIQLEPLTAILTTICDMIEQANNKIKENNDLVDNSKEERKKLQAEVWRFIVEDAQTIITAHNQKASQLEKKIEGLSKGIEDNELKELEIKGRLTELEKRGTSINSSIAEINQTLLSFGFKGFSLNVSDKPGYYKIVRPDGKDVEQSLSEGEKTFVTFLYFYHLLKGSQSQTGVTTPRVAVFDDPVSSLDSEVLFIVSTLIKSVIASIVDDGPVRQVILLTHNMYFFKEVSFKSSKQIRAEDGTPKLGYTYWTVSKRDEITQIERHNSNPIKSAYQMLWDEVKQQDCSRHTIRNTLRRILEYYFTTIGSQSLDDLPSHFTGAEQSICRSLISWVHEGSHFTDDDYTVVPSLETVDRQKAVFKRIFEETRHIEHYNMMMGEAEAVAVPVVAEAVA
ncbi:AAA family ATPase [Terasakiella pusilla]|uniref:AAA family ATPase n=1 Tax=Terasakiella pusilla TaxID=64973 RepID=UPI003AA817E2